MVQFKHLLAAGALLASTAYAVTPVAVHGSDFVNAISGTRFQLIGVAYQPGGSSGFNPGSGIDPLSNATDCLRDAILMQKLGVNTVRIYNLDPTIDHTACMSIFNAAGIYVLLDVNSPLPNQSLNRAAPWESYNPDYMERVFQMIEAFKNFNNTLGFFSANEVINEDSVPLTPAYIRAVTRDMKDYINKHCPRYIPVGYSAADVRPLLVDTYNYLGCNLANDTQSKMDFFGLNSYSWCGDATYQSSTYEDLVNDFANTSIPIFFSEYGCNKVAPRTFTEVATIYSTPFDGVMSGGMVYEYSEEPNDYGLVNINDDGSINILVDYNNLMSAYSKIDLQALTAQNTSAVGRTAESCSNVQMTSNLTTSFAVPARLPDIQTMINNGVNGTYPTGFTSVTSTKEPVTVTNVDGSALTGLQLRILANDQSNLPGDNTSGTNGTGGPGLNNTSSGSNGKGSGKSAATAVHVNFGALVVAAITLGFWVHL